VAHRLAGGDHRPGEGAAPVGDVDVEPEGAGVVDDPDEDGVRRAHGVVRERLRGRHHRLGQQLAAVDHPAVPTVAGPDEAAVGTGLHVEERQHPPDAGPGRGGPRPGRHRPDTAGMATPTRTSTTSWKKARWPASRATSGRGSSYRQASTSTPPMSARR